MITSLDVRDRLIALLQADPLIASPADFPHPITPFDPDDVDEATGVDLCVAIPGEALSDATLGGRNVGTDTKLTQLVLLVYVWADRRDRERTDLCIRLTNRLLEAVRRYQVDPTPGDGRWHKAEFVPQRKELSTVYITIAGSRHASVTVLNLYSRVRRS